MFERHMPLPTFTLKMLEETSQTNPEIPLNVWSLKTAVPVWVIWQPDTV
jgi:hypothetical protein